MPENDAERAPSALQLSPDLSRRLAAWAAGAYPSEGCGLLLGLQTSRGASVVDVIQTRNIAREHAGERYELDPVEHMRAELAARARGLAVVGVWHSHPDRRARPSELDRRAAYENWSYLIVATGELGVREMRSWRLEGRAFREEAISAERLATAP